MRYLSSVAPPGGAEDGCAMPIYNIGTKRSLTSERDRWRDEEEETS